MKADVPEACPKCGKRSERRFGVPVLRTNTQFFAGAKYGAEQFAGGDPRARKMYLDAAKKAGVDVNGKIYQHAIARFPGDPMAWCDPDKDDVRKRGDLLHGKAKRHIQEHGPGPSVTVAEDIIDAEVERRIEAGTLLAHEADSRREEIADSMARWDKVGKYKRPKKKSKKAKR